MSKATRYALAQRERAIRLVREHRDEYPSEWAAIQSIAGKLGMTPETLRLWVRRDEVDHGRRPGVTSAERERIRDLEREVRELRRANEILKAASAFFACMSPLRVTWRVGSFFRCPALCCGLSRIRHSPGPLDRTG